MLTWLADGYLAILERDNLPGGYTVIKATTARPMPGVEPQPAGLTPPMVEKELKIETLLLPLGEVDGLF